MLNLSVMVSDAARRFGDKTAIVCGDTRLSYAQVDAMSNQVANLLVARGLRPGDHVVLSCPNLPWFPVCYHGILKAGCVVVPINVLLKRREIAYHLSDCDAKAYFCFAGTPQLPMATEGHAAVEETGTENFIILPATPGDPSGFDDVPTLTEAIADQPTRFDPVNTSPDDTAVILYTSGTTGQPKGAELSHTNMVLNAESMVNLHPRRNDDVLLVALPLFHSFGQSVQLNGGFLTGATLVLLPRFDPGEALRLMDAENVTGFAGVPTMWWALLNHKDATGALDTGKLLSRLRLATSGGSPLPLEVLRRLTDDLGVHLLEGYGLSETSPVATFNHLDRDPKPGSVGFPIWGIEAKLVDEDFEDVEGSGPAEIAIRGHNVMKGYYKRPEETAAVMRDGWFRTGDLATRDEDGYFFIVDRAKDMIIRGGYNVYPREVEELLVTHPDVSLAAVVGVPHESLGEEIKAYVIANDGHSPDPDEVVAWSKERLASYKYPRTVEVVDSLPMTSTGKILKRELRG